MIYYLGLYLQDAVEVLSFLRLVDSISFRALCGAITSLILTILCGGRVILYFYSRGHRDMPRDYLNSEAVSNQAKTYGGVLIVSAILLSIGLWCKLHSFFVLCCVGAIGWFAALGWTDDFLKVRYRSSDRGLSEKAKLTLQVAFGLAFGTLYITQALPAESAGLATQLYVPFFKNPLLDLSWGLCAFYRLHGDGHFQLGQSRRRDRRIGHCADFFCRGGLWGVRLCIQPRRDLGVSDLSLYAGRGGSRRDLLHCLWGLSRLFVVQFLSGQRHHGRYRLHGAGRLAGPRSPFWSNRNSSF